MWTGAGSAKNEQDQVDAAWAEIKLAAGWVIRGDCNCYVCEYSRKKAEEQTWTYAVDIDGKKMRFRTNDDCTLTVERFESVPYIDPDGVLVIEDPTGPAWVYQPGCSCGACKFEYFKRVGARNEIADALGKASVPLTCEQPNVRAESDYSYKASVPTPSVEPQQAGARYYVGTDKNGRFAPKFVDEDGLTAEERAERDTEIDRRHEARESMVARIDAAAKELHELKRGLFNRDSPFSQPRYGQ